MESRNITSSKVVGVGWARTGTTTLGACFRRLGYRHQTQDMSLIPHLVAGNLQRLMDHAATRDTFEDWPWLLLYRELDVAFPGSRFVLTRRAPERWLASYRAMLAREGPASEALNATRRFLYGLPFPDVTDGALVARVQRHEADVLHYFRDRPHDLLVVDWERGDGWPELCRFLNLPVPTLPFPHLNASPR